MDQVLAQDTLTVATAQRQWLAARRSADPVTAVHHLVGVQAQEPTEPQIGLLARLHPFSPHDLTGPLEDRRLARAVLMRRTIHLVTAADAIGLRRVHGALLRQKAGQLLRQVRDAQGAPVPIDHDDLTAAAAAELRDGPLILSEVARRVLDRFPEVPVRVLADAISSLVPLVQVPPRGVWGAKGAAACVRVEQWWPTVPPVVQDPASDLVLRYLAAHGPAATADLRAFSGAAGLPAVVTALGDQLTRHRDEKGRVLWDLADRPVLDPGLPGHPAELPVRFLPAFDNAVLGYHDRSRLIDDEHRGLSIEGARYVLVAGRVAGTWTDTGRGGTAPEAVLTVHRLRPWTDRERAAVGKEADRLAAAIGAATVHLPADDLLAERTVGGPS